MEMPERNNKFKREALNRRGLFMAIAIGFTVGIIIIQPLGNSLFQYVQFGDFSNWWHLLKEAFEQAVRFRDMDQILKNALFGILGSSLALMFYTRKALYN